MQSEKRSFLIFLPVALLGFALSFYRINTLDVFWHLKVGQLILETGGLLTTNLFSSIYPDHHWPNPEWLFQVVLASVHRLGGWRGLSLMKLTLVFLLAAALFAALRKRAARPVIAAALTVFVLCGVQPRLTERPHLFSYLFFALTMLVVEDHRKRGGRALWLLPPLFALWSNFHPELIFGLLYLGAVGVGELLRERGALLRRARKSRIFRVALLCAAATLLNPEGYHVIIFPFLHTVAAPAFVVTEYAPPTIQKFPFFFASLMLTVVGLAVRGRREYGDWLLIGGTGLVGVLYLRSTPYFFLVAAPALQGVLAGGLSPACMARRNNLVAMLLASVALAWAFAYDHAMTYRWGWGVAEELYPIAAADLLASRPFPDRLYNIYNHGGYLIYRLYPKMGVFQDGRVQAYPRSFVKRLHAKVNLEGWSQLVEDYDVQTALVPWSLTQDHFDTEEWGLVFWDRYWAVFVRRLPSNSRLLEELEYRHFFPDVKIASIWEPKALELLLAEMERNQDARRLQSPLVANTIGGALIRLGRREEAVEAFRAAVTLDGGYGPAWANLGMLLAESGAKAEAAHALGRAAALDPSLVTVKEMLDKLGTDPN